MVFGVRKSDSKDPNTAEISINNLSATTRGQMQKKGAKVVLLAGYAANQAQIFSGDARSISHLRDGPDWVTKLQCGDGETSYAYDWITESFRAGTSVGAVLNRIAESMRVGLGNVRQQAARLSSEQFVHGYAAHGRASAELNRILHSRGYTWSIQDGQLQVLKRGEYLPTTALVINAESGLIGTPELHTGEKKPDKKSFTPKAPLGEEGDELTLGSVVSSLRDAAKGASSIQKSSTKDKGTVTVLKIRSLMQPSVKPGGLIRVESFSHTGQYRVVKVEHRGDTAGSDWYSDIEAVPTSEFVVTQ
jgi:hypothetical protein